MRGLLLSLLLPSFAAAGGASVYEVRPSLDWPVTLGAGAATLSVYVFGDGLVNKRCPCDAGGVNPIDRPVIGNHSGVAEWFSDGAVGAAVLVPVVADYLDVGYGPIFLEDMQVFAETLSVNGALVTAAKYSVQRPLPRTYAGEPDYVKTTRGYRSCYSGHASTAAAALVAAAQTARLRHDTGWGPWFLAVAISLGVGFERVAAGKHFYSDVVVGSAAGVFVGTVVPYLHERGSFAGRLALVPTPDGAAALWTVRF